MGIRPSLLFLSQTLPYPPDGGVNIRTYNVLRQLARTFEITVLCFYRRKTGMTEQDLDFNINALREHASVEAFPIPQEHSLFRLLWDHGRSLISGRAYTLSSYESRAFRSRLRELLRERSFDLIHVDSLDLAGYLPLLDLRSVACVHHNVESHLLRRRASAEPLRWRSAYLAHQARLVEREERKWCSRLGLNVAVSANDEVRLRSIAGAGQYTVAPNGVDIDAFTPQTGRDDGIVFVGGTTWFPNRDALDFFCQEILPLIRMNGETAPVSWVGRATQEERTRARERYSVEMTGYVPDVRPWVNDAACFIVPLRVGGGTRLKILDAWALGKAVVSTSVGCEGLEAIDGTNILIRDTPHSFAAAVSEVLHDPELRRRVGRAARETVEQHYAWDIIGDRITKSYLELLDRGSAEANGSSTRGRRVTTELKARGAR